MRKDLGSFGAVYPMPVLMIAAYDENGKVNVMNAAWGMLSDGDTIALFISPGHKTTKNIRTSKAFTVSLADRAHEKEADFFGIASGNSMSDKFARSGLHAVKSTRVNAPVIEEFPVTMECELIEIVDTDNLYTVLGRIVNTSVDEKVLDERGKVDVAKAGILIFDRFRAAYHVTGERVGSAWSDGKALL